MQLFEKEPDKAWKMVAWQKSSSKEDKKTAQVIEAFKNFFVSQGVGLLGVDLDRLRVTAIYTNNVDGKINQGPHIDYPWLICKKHMKMSGLLTFHLLRVRAAGYGFGLGKQVSDIQFT
jgi:hypothetical protein